MSENLYYCWIYKDNPIKYSNQSYGITVEIAVKNFIKFLLERNHNTDISNQSCEFLVAIREDKDTYGIVYYYNLEKDIVEAYEKEKHDKEIIKITSESEEE